MTHGYTGGSVPLCLEGRRATAGDPVPRCPSEQSMHRALIAVAFCIASVNAQESLGPPVEFPNVPEIPLPAGVDFQNPFAKDRPVRIVFGVADPGRLPSRPPSTILFPVFLSRRSNMRIAIWEKAVAVAVVVAVFGRNLVRSHGG